MPRHLVVLGFLTLVIVGMGFVSVIGGSWDWSAATASSILLWLALAVVVPRWVHRSTDTSPH